MKKVIIVLIALCLVTASAEATIIDLVKDPGHAKTTTTHAATAADPMDIGETMCIQVYLNNNHFMVNLTGSSYYAPKDGYNILVWDINLAVSSQGKISASGPMFKDAIKFNGSLVLPGAVVGLTDSGIQFIGAGYGINGLNAGTEPVLSYNLMITAMSGGIIDITPGLNYTTLGDSINSYALYSNGDYEDIVKNYDISLVWERWDMVASDFGALQLHVVPEPLTIALLGLGSLGMMYRRRRS